MNAVLDICIAVGLFMLVIRLFLRKDSATYGEIKSADISTTFRKHQRGK